MKGKSTKSALLMSFTSLLLCFAMLIGCTFAWFTDSVSSGVNKIQAGNLDIEVSYNDGNQWKSIQDVGTLFSSNLWEPGHTEYVTLKIENKGTLAFNYKLNVSPVSESGGINMADQSFKLSDYLVFKTTNAATTAPTYANRQAARDAATGAEMKLNQTNLSQGGVLYPSTQTTETQPNAQYITLVVYMPETVGNEANYKTGTEAPQINLGITVVATQKEHEVDSFGPDYDGGAETDTSYTESTDPTYAESEVQTLSQTVSEGVNTVFVSSLTPSQETGKSTTITFPEDIAEMTAGSTAELEVEVTPTIAANMGFKIASEGAVGAISLDVTVDGNPVTEFKDAAGNPQLVKIETYVAKNLTQVSLTYGDSETWTQVETEANVNAEHKFFYDSESGKLVYMTKHFSTFLLGAAEVAYIESTNMAYLTIEGAFEAATDTNTVVTLLKDATVSDNVNTTKSFIFDLNSKTLKLTDPIDFGAAGGNETVSVTSVIRNGTVSAASGAYLRYEDGCTVTLKDVVFRSTESSRSTEILQVYAQNMTAAETVNRYTAEGCTFDNCTISFDGASNSVNNFATIFRNCRFTNSKFISGYGDTVVKYDSNVYGTATFDGCSFDIVSARGGSSAATAIWCYTYSGNVGANKLAVTLNNVTISGTTEGSSSFYPMNINQETDANCPTTVTRTGTNTFTRNGASCFLTYNTYVYSVNYRYQNISASPATVKISGVDQLSYKTNVYSYYNVVITLLENCGDNIELEGQTLIIPAGKTYTGTVSTKNGYTLKESHGEDGSTTYASVQAEFAGVEGTLMEALLAQQAAGAGEVKLLSTGATYPTAKVKMKQGTTLNLNGNTLTNKPVAVDGYVAKLDGQIYSVDTAVAKVNTTYYGSLADALAGTSSNPTITLLQDCNEDLELPAATNPFVVLDTNGFNYTGTVTAPEGYTVQQNGYYYLVPICTLTIGEDTTCYNGWRYSGAFGIGHPSNSGSAAQRIQSATEDSTLTFTGTYTGTETFYFDVASGKTLTIEIGSYISAEKIYGFSGCTKTVNGNIVTISRP